MALYLVGAFAVVLGLLHFTFPRRFGYPVVLRSDGPRPPAFRLGPYRRELRGSDLLGIVYVMNHSASLAILSIGVLDLLASQWAGTWAGRCASGWAAVFWWVRAASQLYVGHRRGDVLVIAWFTMLGLVQLLGVVRP
jgi:hypothetical protein